MENKLEKIFIECDCGTHVLLVQNEVEFFDETNAVTSAPRVRQEFDLAMFNYAAHTKPSFFERIRIIWNYFKTGKMHSDQLCLNVDEAKKLADFINNSIVPTQKNKLKRFVLKKYPERFWDIAELQLYDENNNLIKTYNVNKFYEVKDGWFFIYDAEGGTGTGYSKGEVLQKIYIGDAEYEVDEK